jgi:hypothetical protein
LIIVGKSMKRRKGVQWLKMVVCRFLSTGQRLGRKGFSWGGHEDEIFRFSFLAVFLLVTSGESSCIGAWFLALGLPLRSGN